MKIWPCKNTESSNQGFTTIEILIVLAIIAILSTLVVTSLWPKVGETRRVTAKNQIESLALALNSYKLDNGDYPTTAQGLAALRTAPSPAPLNWNGPYIENDVPKDPWGKDYIYVCPGVHNPSGFDLQSLGKDGVEGGEGENADITNWGSGK